MSRTSAIPDLIDALIAEAKGSLSLPAVIVTDGVDIPNDPGFRFMVGVSDPDSPNPQPSAQADQDWANATPQSRWETGFVSCAVYGWSGNTAKEIRDEVFRIAGVIQTLLRGNIPQAVAGMAWTSYGDQNFEQWLDTQGNHALLMFRVNFKARL
jgi:hypothetical protein